MLFFMFINVKMPTIVGILTFMSRKNSMLMKKGFITSGPGFVKVKLLVTRTNIQKLLA